MSASPQPRPRLRRLRPEEVEVARRDPVDSRILPQVEAMVAAVRDGGETRLRQYAEEFDGVEPGQDLRCGPEELAAALEGLPGEQRALLERTADRIRDFAQAQKEASQELDVAISGGRAGHRIVPVDRAGCYAPGGRYPLPSSVLMTAVVARVAGVREVWVASPRPTPVTLAAAAVAGADGLLRVGGAQAIAALAYGVGVPACDVIAGPGNSWVTAAKYAVSRVCRIDLLAGPTELVVVADATAEADWIAADLLAQAEHDPVAMPILLTDSQALIEEVERSLEERLRTLPTAEVAQAALGQGFAVLTRDLEETARLSDRLAGEHVALHGDQAEKLLGRLRHGGAFFPGSRSAEVFGDYGVGPNHVLPTGGTGRFQGGLSVHTFSKVSTWLRMDPGPEAAAIARDAAALARLEGLEGHARAAECRL